MSDLSDDLQTVLRLMDETVQAADEYLKSKGQNIVVARAKFDDLLKSIYATAQDYLKRNIISKELYHILISFKNNYEKQINDAYMKKMNSKAKLRV